MDRPFLELVERLGTDGLARVLDDLLEQGQVVRLANACGLRYPGMRVKSQSRKRLVADLAAKAEKNDEARTAILRLLTRQAAGAAKAWDGLPSEEKARRLSDEPFLRQPGNLGLHLLLLARASDAPAGDGVDLEAARRRLLSIAANGDGTHAATADAREPARLRKRLAALEKKVQYLEVQLVKSRETQKALKQDLIQRKGELAESRMLVERLRADLATRASVPAPPSPVGPAEESLGEVARALRKLTTEQKNLARSLSRPRDAAPNPVPPSVEALGGLTSALADLHRDLAGLRRDSKKQLEVQANRLDEVRAELRLRRDGAAGPAKRSRVKGDAERVGVFIDVQNMYYGARQLKGKVDFDALLSAATHGRRLIQATAYVVETKDIDQSQFIAILQQRAIEVRRKPLQVRADGSMKGDWDMELALDILDAAPRLDVVVLVSGDGDFTSLVKRVKGMGPRVEVIAFPRNTAKSLLEAADHFQPLDRRLMIYERGARAAVRKPAPDEREADEAPLAAPRSKT